MTTANQMRVGVQLPEVEREVPWPEYAAMARAAEDVGFDSIWLGDHLLYRDDGREERGPWDAWSLLGALAAVTDRVRLGSLVACTGFGPAGLLARKAAAVQEISGGRLVLGLGAGWNETEFRAFGVPFDHRAARFEEAFEVVRRLLDGERVTFRGRFVQTDDAVLLPRPRERPELMVGSVGPRVLRATLPFVDSWNCWYLDYGNTAMGFARVNARIDAAVAGAGRAPGEVRRSACVLVAFDPGAGERPVDAEAPAVEGSPEAIAGMLRDLADAGADEAICVGNPITEATIRTVGRALDLLDA